MCDETPVCIICYDETFVKFNPYDRPRQCKCVYFIHKECYQKWLTCTDTTFNCAICHSKVDRTQSNVMSVVFWYIIIICCMSAYDVVDVVMCAYFAIYIFNVIWKMLSERRHDDT